MVRCTYLYETPMGFSFGDVVAESREAADREFWSRHHRDTCRVVSVSVAREPEGEERAEALDCGLDVLAGLVSITGR